MTRKQYEAVDGTEYKQLGTAVLGQMVREGGELCRLTARADKSSAQVTVLIAGLRLACS